MNETDIELQARKAKTSVDNLVKSLNNVNDSLNDINKSLTNLDKKTNTSIKETTKSLDKLNDALDSASQFKKYRDSMSKIGSEFSNLIEYTKMYSSLTNGSLIKGIQGGTTAWIKNLGVLSKANVAVASITVAWSSFAKQYKENEKFKDSVDSMIASFQPLINYCKKLIESLKSIIDATVNNFISNISTSIKMVKDVLTLDFKSLTSDLSSHADNFQNNMKNVGVSLLNALPFVHIETEAEKLANKLKEVEKSLFNNDGISLSKYKESVDEMLESIVNNTPSIDKYNEIMENSKIKYQEAGESLQILLTQMGTNLYVDTADDIKKLNDSLDAMTSSVKNNGQAFTDATTVIINGLLEEGRISEETAMKVIESAITKAKIENDSMEQYRLEIEKLNNERKKGTITAEEFRQKQLELSKEFFSTSDIVEQTKNTMSNYVNLVNSMNLDLDSWDGLNNIINDIGESFSENQNKLDQNAKSQKNILEELQMFYKKEIEEQNKVLENLKSNGDEQSKEYLKAQQTLDDYLQKNEEITNSLSALYTKQQDDSKELKQVTVDSILGIISQMKSSGVDMQKEGKDTVEKINALFKTLGLKDAINLEQNMNDIIKEMNDKLGLNIPTMVNNTNKDLSHIGEDVNPVVEVTADITKAQSSFDKLINKLKGNSVLNVLVGGVLGLGLKSTGGVFSNGTWKNVPQYANGGIPTHGSVFVAGERGAEIVGHINGRTEVLNQSQIASAIYSAMINAMSQFNGGIAEINVHADKGIIVETAVNGINRYVKQTGELPFAIPIN